MNILAIGASASKTFQNAISVTSHNIANASTSGYHKQRVYFKDLPDYSGVEIDSIKQSYSSFLESENKSLSSKLSFLEESSSWSKESLSKINSLDLESLESSISDVIKNPASIPARQLFLDQAEQFSKNFNTINNDIQDLENQMDKEISLTKDAIKIDLESLKNLNEKNQEDSNILDQQNNILKDLSQKISFKSIKTNSGKINIYLDPKGNPLLLGTIIPETNITSENISGGTLKGILDSKNNLKSLKTEITNLGTSIAENINNQLKEGKDLNNNSGKELFTLIPNINVIIQDPKELAVADMQGGNGNNENFLKINLKDFLENLNLLKTNLNSKDKQIQDQKNVINNLKESSDQEISSFSEVNLDEELVNLMQYKQSYEAAAKVIQVGTEIFDTLLNSLKR